jgi:hypothetical protein
MARIHFIGGEKGGVGKSVVARLLAQYWIDQNTAWRGFDTDRSHGALLRYYDGFAEPIEVTVPEQLDRIMEAAGDDVREILVDLAAQSEHSLHQWIDSADVLGLASELSTEVFFWHVMDDGKDSVDLLGRLFERYGDTARYVIVLNHGRGSDFSMFHESTAYERTQTRGIPVVELRPLHRPTMLRIDRHDKSFWGAANSKGHDTALGLMERQRVKVWTRAAYAEFQRLGL